MSAQSVESILSKAMSDPEKALAGYDLTAEDLAKFKGLTRAKFEAMTPEERNSFSIVMPDRKGSMNHNQSALSVK